MPLWKKILLRTVGFGAGFALSLFIAIAVAFWYHNRPKPPSPWNRKAITAEYDDVDTEGKERRFVFAYTLQNNTFEDFRLESEGGINLTVKLKRQQELGEFSHRIISLEYPLFIPAKSRVRVTLHLETPYAMPEDTISTNGDAKTQRANVAAYVTRKMQNLPASRSAAHCRPPGEPDRRAVALECKAQHRSNPQQQPPHVSGLNFCHPRQSNACHVHGIVSYKAISAQLMIGLGENWLGTRNAGDYDITHL